MYQTAHSSPVMNSNHHPHPNNNNQLTTNNQQSTEQHQGYSQPPYHGGVAGNTHQITRVVPIPQQNYQSTNSFQTPLVNINPSTPSKSNTSQGLIQAGTNAELNQNNPQQYIVQTNTPTKAGGYAYYSAPNPGGLNANIATTSTNQPQYTNVANYGMNQPGYATHKSANPQAEVQNYDTKTSVANPQVEDIRTRVVSDEPQLVFSCKHCRTIFIDSNALFYNGEEHGIITFLKAHRVEVRESNVQIAPLDRFDAGSNYYPIFCKLCQSLVGRKYVMSDKSPIVDIIGYYTLDIDALSLYELWTADQETGIPGENIGGGHVDNMKSIPTMRTLMNEITTIKKAMLSLQEDQNRQEGRFEVFDNLKQYIENNESIKRIPQLTQKVDELQKEFTRVMEEQHKITHVNRRLGIEVVHIKKETGITPLGSNETKKTDKAQTTPTTTTTSSSNAAQNPKKRLSTGSTMEQQTTETNTKKKKQH